LQDLSRSELAVGPVPWLRHGRPVRVLVRTPARPVPGDRGRHDLAGLVANVAAATDPSTHAHVAAQIVAATVARMLAAAQLGEELAAQLCLLSLGLSHSYPTVDAGPHLTYLRTRWEPVLARIADGELDSVYLWLTNIAAGLRADHASPLIDHLWRRHDAVDDPETALPLQDRLEIYTLRRLLDAGQRPDPDATLDAWQPRRTRAAYAYVLYLLASGPLTQRLQRESAEVIDGIGRYLGETGVVLLTNRLAQAEEAGLLAPGGITRTALVRALRQGVQAHLRHVQLPEAEESLRQLLRLDPPRGGTYRALLLDLKRDQLRLLDEQSFAQRLARHRYALLFLEYWDMFGALVDVRSGPGFDGSAAEVLLAAAGAAFVDPGQREPSARFVAGLNEVYRGGLREDPTLDEVRARFNDTARQALGPLLALFADVAEMPADMAGLLRRHRAQVERASATDVRLDPPDPR
jgi:hypothetical protein